MVKEIQEGLYYLKYWQYFPAQSQRTKPRLTRSRRIIGSIEAALKKDMEPMEYFAEDPQEPRFILLLYPGDRKRIGARIFGDILTVGTASYRSKSGMLKKLMESLPASELESIQHCPDLHFSEDK